MLFIDGLLFILCSFNDWYDLSYWTQANKDVQQVHETKADNVCDPVKQGTIG